MNNNPSPFKGIARSPEVKQRISEALKGKPRNLTPEQRAARAAIAKRVLGGPRSDEHKRRISEALKGKKKSPEHVQRMSEGKQGVVPVLTEEQKQAFKDRMSALHKGVPKSEESKLKSSATQSGQSSLLDTYGISREEYAEQRKLGNRWCSTGKHWGPSADFTSGEGRPFCDAHKQDHHRASLLRGTYGVDSAWYESTLAAQGGGCAICGRHKVGKGHRFMPIDHSHATGKVRSILCSRCNALVGFAESGMFEEVFAYLEKHAEVEPIAEFAPDLPPNHEPRAEDVVFDETAGPQFRPGVDFKVDTFTSEPKITVQR